MGTIAQELIKIKQSIDDTKDIINKKYRTMGLPEVTSLLSSELPSKVDGIPVLNTGDANATPADILDGKTGYVNDKKVTGTMQEKSGKTSMLSVKSANDTKVTFNISEDGHFDSTSTFQVGASLLAAALNITSDKIKKGETILGVQGSLISGRVVSYNPPDMPYYFQRGFKWGWFNLFKNSGYDIEATCLLNLYDRLYSAYYYSGQIDGYYIESNKDKIFAPTYEMSDGTYLSVYVKDLFITYPKLTVDMLSNVFTRILYDCPELIPQFTGFATLNQDGVPAYMVFHNFDKDTLESYKATCLSAFKEICGIIKSTYGISWPKGNGYYDCINVLQDGNILTNEQRLKVAKVIHDWLVLNNTYAHSTVKNLDQTMFPALSKGIDTPVCASYAHAFQWLCQKWGICAVPVLGSTTNGPDGRHMWNMVCYDLANFQVVSVYDGSKWSEVDVTWDDPTGRPSDYIIWNFFNVATSYIQGPAGGNRVRAILGNTSFGNEWVTENAVENCTCLSYTYNGNVKYGGL